MIGEIFGFLLHNLGLYAITVLGFAFQRKMEEGKGTSNITTLFGVNKIPTDNLVRKIVDKIDPYLLQPVYDDILKLAQQHGIIKQFVVMGEYILITLDGTYYHSSKTIKCDCCQTRTSSETEETTYLHSCITPAIVNPNIKKAIPTMQEFISNSDGDATKNDKQDCEVKAAKVANSGCEANFQLLITI